MLFLFIHRPFFLFVASPSTRRVRVTIALLPSSCLQIVGAPSPVGLKFTVVGTPRLTVKCSSPAIVSVT